LAPMCAGSRQISKTHINRIENGTVTRVSLIKLRALELGLGIPEDNLIAAAQGKLPQTDAAKNEAKLLGYFRQLSLNRQEDVLVILHALAKRIPPNDASP